MDEAIEKAEAVIERLQAAKKSLARKLLSEAWDATPLRDLLAAGPTSGRSPLSRSMPPGVPTFSIAAVRDGVVNVAPHLKYVDVDPAEVSSFVLQPGDILIVRGNANLDLVGRCGIASSVPAGCIYPDILMRIRLKPGVDPVFFVEAWNSEVVRGQVTAKAKTTTGTFKVNQEDLKAISLPLPPLKEQRQITRILQATNDSRLTNCETLSALQMFKNSLATALLSGQVRVTPDEATS